MILQYIREQNRLNRCSGVDIAANFQGSGQYSTRSAEMGASHRAAWDKLHASSQGGMS